MGTSAFAEGFAGVNSRFQADQGIQIDPISVISDTMNYHHCACLAPVVREMVHNSGETMNWFEENGITFAAVAALGNSYPTWHLPADGKRHGNPRLNSARHPPTRREAMGVEFRTEEPMTGLVVENGTVKGVYAQGKEGEIQINAQSGHPCNRWLGE